MKYVTLIAAVGAISLAGIAQAQVEQTKTTERNGVVKTTEILKSGKGLEKITCRSFNALDESFKPEAVDYAVRYTKKGKPVDPLIDVAGIERVTPVVITDCQANPDRTLVQRIKAAFHGKHR